MFKVDLICLNTLVFKTSAIFMHSYHNNQFLRNPFKYAGNNETYNKLTVIQEN